jgi:hypothetical protein
MERARTIETPRRAPGGAIDRLAVEQDLAAGMRNEARDHVEDRGLAATGRADHRDKLALFDIERNVVHRIHMRACARIEISFREVADRQACS